MRSPALPGAVISFLAFVLLLVCTVSTPIWKPVYFLKADVAVSSLGTTLSGSSRFGIWGHCEGGRTDSIIYSGSTTASCSPIKLGYSFDPEILGVDVLSSSKAKRVMPALTGALVLVVVSCALAFLTFITSMFSIFCASRFWEIMSFLWCLLAALIVWISWIINIILFSLVRKRLSSYTNNQLQASYGPALWIQLAAAILLLIATCFTCVGTLGSYRQRRRDRAAGGSGYANSSSHHTAGSSHANNPYGTEKPVTKKWYQRRNKGTGTY
ncbi:SUR7/PalI family-domain-containing protein [Mrakia frigida]|uniref:SUR7/PalI family protein n=1 Tax=Mrakia frigida TaxID=29902 RepID=UPI003FCC13BD